MDEIETSRLSIRRFTLADIDAVNRLLDDCFGLSLRAEREAWLEWTVRNYSALSQLRQPPYGDYAIAIKEGGAVVGSIGLVPSFGPFEKLGWFRLRQSGVSSGLFTSEMGLFWAMQASHRGLGYATEAARAMVAFAFDTLKADRLVATTEYSNKPSVSVMRRLGMTIEANPDPEPEWFQVVGVLANWGGAGK